VEGKRRPDLPIFILISGRTFSAVRSSPTTSRRASRATLIGETTGGGANPGGTYAVNEALAIFVPTGRAINPVTKTNWEGVGVEPDIPTRPDDAARESPAPGTRGRGAVRENSGLEPREDGRTVHQSAREKRIALQGGNKEEATRSVFDALEGGMKAGIADEDSINALGYFYLNSGKTDVAIAVLTFT